jgi:hypothetical protein
MLHTGYETTSCEHSFLQEADQLVDSQNAEMGKIKYYKVMYVMILASLIV